VWIVYAANSEFKTPPMVFDSKQKADSFVGKLKKEFAASLIKFWKQEVLVDPEEKEENGPLQCRVPVYFDTLPPEIKKVAEASGWLISDEEKEEKNKKRKLEESKEEGPEDEQEPGSDRPRKRPRKQEPVDEKKVAYVPAPDFVKLPDTVQLQSTTDELDPNSQPTTKLYGLENAIYTGRVETSKVPTIVKCVAANRLPTEPEAIELSPMPGITDYDAKDRTKDVSSIHKIFMVEVPLNARPNIQDVACAIVKVEAAGDLEDRLEQAFFLNYCQSV
jgi:hypothetical protein